MGPQDGLDPRTLASVIREKQCRRPIKMSPMSQLEMTLPGRIPGGFGVTVRLMSDGELTRLELPRCLAALETAAQMPAGNAGFSRRNSGSARSEIPLPGCGLVNPLHDALYRLRLDAEIAVRRAAPPWRRFACRRRSLCAGHRVSAAAILGAAPGRLAGQASPVFATISAGTVTSPGSLSNMVSPELLRPVTDERGCR